MIDPATTNGNAMQLVNELPEVEVGTYDGPYLAEYYDIWWGNSEMNEADIPAYWKLIQQQLKAKGQERLVVLDIATGTGRIIKGLSKWSPAASHENLSNVDIIGLDISEGMLDKARKSDIDASKLGSLTWVLGNCLELSSILPKGCSVDLMIMGASSVCELREHGQFEKLLDQAKKVLTPGTGRFYFDLNDLARRDDTTTLAYEGTHETTLLSDPNLVIRDTMRHQKMMDDYVFSSNSHVLVIRRDKADNRDVVLANYSVNFTLRLWDPESIGAIVRKEGMQVADQFHLGRQTYMGIAP